jgi:hypothetical protein
MNALIHAYKDGDSSKSLSLTGTYSLSIEGQEEEEAEESSEEVMSVLPIFYCSNVKLHMTTSQVVL